MATVTSYRVVLDGAELSKYVINEITESELHSSSNRLRLEHGET